MTEPMVSEAPDDARSLAAPLGQPVGRSAFGDEGPKRGGKADGLQVDADDALPLRLALARGSLGIELSRPMRVGPLEIAELAFSLPDLRYPLDLSKGVKQFRNRRGRLQRLVVQASLRDLGAWLEGCFRELLGEPLLGARVWALPLEQPADPLTSEVCGLGIGLYSVSRSLAFDLLWCPQEDSRFVLDRPRGVGIEASALALALRAVDAVVAAVAPRSRVALVQTIERQGRAIVLHEPAHALCQVILPAFGCRVPESRGTRAGRLEVREGVLELAFDVETEPPDLPRSVLLAQEAAYHLRSADDLLARGEDDAARDALLQVLMEAVGLPPAVLALADLDAGVPGRQEAALSTLEEVGGAERAGTLGAQVLVAAGHIERAREALLEAARLEPFGPLAAQLYARAGQLAESPAQRLECWDRAVARAPQLSSVRWLRFEDRVRRGDVEGALADAQHLEAAAQHVAGRHEVCLRAGRRLAEAGHGDVARRLLEKALRYAPDDPAARAALGRLFASLGWRARAVTLLQSAVQLLSESNEVASGELLLDLGRLLAELEDLPQAIARLRQVSARSPVAVEARSLEAEYCERMGDKAGASRAYARLREAAELGWVRGEEVVRVLCRGARFEESQGELAAAERHWHAALALAPRDEQVSREYRRVAALYAAMRSGGLSAEAGTEGAADDDSANEPDER